MHVSLVFGYEVALYGANHWYHVKVPPPWLQAPGRREDEVIACCRGGWYPSYFSTINISFRFLSISTKERYRSFQRKTLPRWMGTSNFSTKHVAFRFLSISTTCFSNRRMLLSVEKTVFFLLRYVIFPTQ